MHILGGIIDLYQAKITLKKSVAVRSHIGFLNKDMVRLD